MKSEKTTEPKIPGIEVHIQAFPIAKPKFTKKSWESGENGGEGGEGGV
jgi:hypothetical protein